MSRWFRFYDDVVNDPKVQRLAPDLFKAWVNILCIISKADGALPPIEEVAFTLRVKVERATKWVNDLTAGELLDLRDDGSFVAHNWNARQFKSDVSNERVKRHRERQRNVTPTVTVAAPETEQRQTTDSEQKEPSLRSVDDWPKDFRDRFWKAYPRKAGKALAVRKLETVRKGGKVTFIALMAGVDRYASACLQIETQFQKHPATWLNAGCWDDDADALKRSTGPPRINGPQGFESLFQKPEVPPDDLAPRSEFDLDLTANPAA